MADCFVLMQMVITADSVLPCRHHQGQQRVHFGKIERKAAIAKAHTSEAAVSTFSPRLPGQRSWKHCAPNSLPLWIVRNRRQTIAVMQWLTY